VWQDYVLNAQVSCYLWAARKIRQDDRITQMIVDVIELAKLPAPGRKCRTHGVDQGECAPFHARWEQAYAYRSELQLEEWHRCAVSEARRLKQLHDEYNDPRAIPYVRMRGMFTSACRFCDFRDFCRADRPLHWLGDRLIKRVDEPVIEEE
jgi:hypothetical protein